LHLKKNPIYLFSVMMTLNIEIENIFF